MIPRESIESVLDYLEDDESADFAAEFGEDNDTDPDPECTHVYSHMTRVRTWLEGEPAPLVLTLPRDDMAVLMDAIARCEQGQKPSIDDGMVAELSRIASDLSQQADGQ
jgi:hypothetical protein